MGLISSEPPAPALATGEAVRLGPLATVRRLVAWVFEGPDTGGAGAHPSHHQRYPWWKVMCLTGVDYFSTLGYQPGIAFLAAGVLAPMATLILVLVTLFVALPVYFLVAKQSPHGQGSIFMLENLLPRWRGKLTVLALLGFAATDFIITITLSAADATAHIIENPLVPAVLNHRVLVTLLLLVALGAVFVKGFKEAIGLAVVLVVGYLSLNAAVIAVSMAELIAHPEYLGRWREALFHAHGDPLTMLAMSAFLFPKLALGLSGFETGVALMPLVKGDATDTEEEPHGRVRSTRRLLATAAIIMSFFLMASSIVTTTLIPAEAFAKGGAANGRALAYLAHAYLGGAFGTLYDFVTIAILWFAGASAMAGLLNLVPRYLPPYGMAPEWARATRPLTLVFTLIAIWVTILFDADVDAQGGAYATGVLALMTSAAVAVAIAQWQTRGRWLYVAMTAVFGYTFALNVAERPEGVKIATVFIVVIVAASFASRAWRSTELRITHVELDDQALAFVQEARPRGIHLVAHRPDKRHVAEYDAKEHQSREDHSLDSGEPIIFVEITQGDASEFTGDLRVRGVTVGRHKLLRCKSPAVPNALAALLLHVRDLTGQIPNAYFGWTEGSPVAYVLKYLAFGEGDTAPVAREILRRAIANPLDRPRIHVG